MNGMEILFSQMMKSAGINPAEIVAHITGQIQEGVSYAQSADKKLALIYSACVHTSARLSRIEADQRRIMEALHIEPDIDVEEIVPQLVLILEG